jgi:hypothetical protein
MRPRAQLVDPRVQLTPQLGHFALLRLQAGEQLGRALVALTTTARGHEVDPVGQAPPPPRDCPLLLLEPCQGMAEIALARMVID